MHLKLLTTGRSGRKMLVAVTVIMLLLAFASVAFAGAPRPNNVIDVKLADRLLAPMGKSTLGDFVWHDTDADGIQDTGENGINLVRIELFLDANENGVPEPGESVGFMNTGDNPDTVPVEKGWYDFDVTADGNIYIAQVAASNFDFGGALYNYVLTSDDLSMPAEQYWIVPLPGLIEDINSADFGYALALLAVQKTSTTQQITAAGQLVPYTFAVTNPGDVPLTGITVTDPNCNAAPVYTTGDTNADNALQRTETWTYTCSHTVTQAEIDTRGGGDNDLDNIVTADSNETGSVTDDHFIPITYNPLINVEKTSSTTQITVAGQVVPYTFVVTNPGNVTLTGVTISDPNCTSAISAPAGDTNNDGKLQRTETWTYTCNHTVTQVEIDTRGGGDNDLDNTVTVDSFESGPDTDDHFIPITYNPLINVEKSSSTTQITVAGQVVPYTFVVTNPGNVTLTGVTISDPNCTSAISAPAGDTNNDGKLQVTETWTYTCNHTVTQAEIDGQYPGDKDLDNTVTADSSESGPDTDDHFIPIVYNPLINVEKSSSTTQITVAGQVVPYTFVVTNPGNLTLTGVTISDPNCTSPISAPAGDTNNDGKLQVTETWTYTCNHTVTQAEIDGQYPGDKDLDNTVTVDSNETGPDTAQHAVPIVYNPLINVEKTSSTTQITVAGQVVPYTFVVTNPGNLTLTGITISDPNCTSAISAPAGDTNNDGKLQVTETWTYTCNHSVTQVEIDTRGGGDNDLDNTVTVDSSESGPDTDDHFIPITYNPLINVEKSSSTTQITVAGQVVPYTFVVTNPGNVTLTGVTISDPKCSSAAVRTSGDTNNDNQLQVTETWTYACNHTVTQPEIDAGTGSLPNTVTADSNESTEDLDNHSIPITYTPLIDLEKYVWDGSEWVDADSPTGPILTVNPQFRFTVRNTGNVTLSNIALTDSDFNIPLNCMVSSLAPGITADCFVNSTLTVGQHSNTGNVSGSFTDANSVKQTVTDTDLAHYLGGQPSFNLVKTAGTAPDGQTLIVTAPVPVSVVYHYALQNTGSVAIYVDKTGVNPIYKLTDDKCSPVTYVSGDANNNNRLDVGETWSFQCTTNISINTTNTATVTGNPVDSNGNDIPGLNDLNDSDQAVVEVRSGFGNFVWWDVDGDGVQDAGEPGIPGVTMDLFGYPSIVTDANGAYSFTGLPQGSYVPNIDALVFAPGGPLAGYSMSPVFQGGNTALDSNGVTDGAGGTQASLNLPQYTYNPTIDFGFVKPTSYTLTKVSLETGAIRVGDTAHFKITVNNTGQTFISVLPLVDTYVPTELEFLSASINSIPVAPDSATPLGTLTWNDLTGTGMLAPGASINLFVNFKTLKDTTQPALPGLETVNTASVPKDNTRVDPDGPGGTPEAVPPTNTLTANDGVTVIQPTGLALAASEATVTAEGVAVTWETTDESAILGFNVLRDGVAVNAELILAGAAGTNAGGTYSLVDAVATGTYVYTLEVIGLDGTVERVELGPVTVN